MDNLAIFHAIKHLRGKAEFVLNGNTLDGLVWLDDSEPPSQEEVESAWEKVQRHVLLEPIRAERNTRLGESDWTQIHDAPVDAKAWAAYRQALRDLPATIKDPTQPVDWPTPPE